VSFFGTKGKNILLISVAVFIVAWNIILSVMFSRSISNVTAVALGKEGMDPAFTHGIALVCMVLVFLVVWKGPLVIKRFNSIIAPLMIVVLVVLMVVLTRDIGWDVITNAKPSAPYESNWVNFLIGVELSFGAGLSWWPEMGGLSRLCKTSKAAYWSNLAGLVIAATIGTAVGTAASLTLGSDDPTAWMLPLGGMLFGVMALLFVAVANITSNATITYTICLGLKSLKVFQNKKWGTVVGLFTAVVVICLLLWPDAIYDNFYILLGVTCAFYVPLTAIGIVDYFLLRGQTLDLRSIFNISKTSKYYYWGGFNWVAIIVFVAAMPFYLVFFKSDYACVQSALRLFYSIGRCFYRCICCILHPRQDLARRQRHRWI
jgi:NCS1 family nucleobase:cation symporter-1